MTIYAGPELLKTLQGLRTDLRALFIVSTVSLAPLADAPADAVHSEETEDAAVSVTKAEGAKCARCWIYSTNLGSDQAWPDACPRCTQVLKSL